MDKRKLEQLAPLRKELEDIEKRIDKINQVTTIEGVRASGKDFPYVEHTVKIEGINHKGRNYLKRKWTRCRNKIKNILKYIEEELENIEDSETRQIIRYKYEDGMSWIQIQHKMGYRSEEKARIKLKRFLKNF